MMVAQAKPRAWLPLTPRGVAAFARAPATRLFLVQFVFAALGATAVVWFLHTHWLPTVRTAIQQLPARGEIRNGRLAWEADSPRVLADGHFLAFTVDLSQAGRIRLPAHVQVEFGRDSVRFFSLLGYTEYPYPKGWTVAFNRTELEPWWGAWEPPVQWIAVVAVVVGLMLGWALMASLYSAAIWLAGFFVNRDLDLPSSWKMAGAALMPGALLMTAGVAFYGMGVLGLVELITTACAHVIAGWIYLFASLLCVKAVSPLRAVNGNPFSGPPGDATEAREKEK